MSRGLVLATMVTAQLLAACLGGGGPDLPDAPLAAEMGPVPAACDAKRSAIVHGKDGVPIEDPARAPGVPCFSESPYRGYEPSLGLTSDGTLFLYPAWLDNDLNDGVSDRLTGMGVARTKDDGANWTRHESRIGPINHHPFTADPFMYVDPYTDRIFIEDLILPPFNCSNLSFSDDHGETWTQTLGGCLVWDHVSIAAGPPVTSTPQGYPTVVQRCAITLILTTLVSEGTACQKSLDGGMTWQPPGEPAFLFGPEGLPYIPSTCHGAAHHVFVDHRGWTWLGRDWCGTGPWVALSKDEGATWERQHVHAEPIPWHDVGVGADTAGNAYAFWMSAERRPLLAVSHDDGATWSTPMDIAPAGLLAAAGPSLVPGGAGKVAITYTANFESDGGAAVHAVVVAAYGLDTDDPIFHTAIANHPDEPIASGACGDLCPGQADFLTATLGPDGAPYGSFVRDEDRRVSVGWLFGAPSLWDPGDPNNRYRDATHATGQEV